MDRLGRGVDGALVPRDGERETRGVSPSYTAICLAIADDVATIDRLDTLPPPKRQPNLLLGAVRFLDGPVSSWPAFREFTIDRWDDIAATMLARRTQTNEPARCATLLPALAALPQPLALLEVGASAGLCLYPDRYAYRYEAAAGVHTVGEGGVELHCSVTGPAPLPAHVPEIVWRRGLDLNPLDAADDEDVRWLECLIWPEQTLVVFHSAVLAYVPDDGRPAFTDAVGRLAAARPTVWLSNEAPGVVAGTDADRGPTPRFVFARDAAPIARTGPHGQTLDWLA